MNTINYVMDKTHTLSAILIVDIIAVDTLVSEVINICNKHTGTWDYIKNAIGYIITDSFHNTIPYRALTNLLTTMLLDEYRISLSLSSDEHDIVESLLVNIIKIVNTKTAAVAKTTEYIPLSHTIAVSIPRKVFCVHSVDLITFKNIEFRFYNNNNGVIHG